MINKYVILSFSFHSDFLNKWPDHKTPHTHTHTHTHTATAWQTLQKCINISYPLATDLQTDMLFFCVSSQWLTVSSQAWFNLRYLWVLCLCGGSELIHTGCDDSVITYTYVTSPPCQKAARHESYLCLDCKSQLKGQWGLTVNYRLYCDLIHLLGLRVWI